MEVTKQTRARSKDRTGQSRGVGRGEPIESREGFRRSSTRGLPSREGGHGQAELWGMGGVGLRVNVYRKSTGGGVGSAGGWETRGMTDWLGR